MGDLSRRRLLAGSATALIGIVAGCSSSDDEDGENGENGETGEGTGDEDEPEEPDTGSSTDVDGTILGEITVDNSSESARTIDILVEFDRDIETWETVELAANDDTTLERNWPSDPGQFRVTARLDGDELVQVTPANWNEPDCLNLLVRTDRNGELELHSTTDGGPCSTGEE